MQLAQGRHDFPLDGGVKAQAILLGVIEPAPGAEGIIAVIGKPGVLCDLFAQMGQRVEHRVEFPGFLQPPAGHQFPGLPAKRPVRLFEVARHLHQSLFLAAKLHCERAGQFLVLLAQLRLPGFERHIFIAVEFDPHSGIAVEDIVAAGSIAGRSRARFG